MRVGILGTGGMARALGGTWAAAGHEVHVGGRGGQARAAAAVGAAAHGTFAEAAAYGDVVLVAVPAQVAPTLVRELARPLAGRTLVDCTNPVEPGPGGLVLTTGAGDPLALRLAQAAPGARVAKAFNLCHADVWGRPGARYEGVPLTVPLCADDPGARADVSALVESAGWVPAVVGGLAQAAHLEAAAAFAIAVWRSGGQPRHAFPPVEAG
ncbi:NADPH-dependent F420 reductase [Streptomyces sp. NPDC050560]|uniref:NADPH-dependent F420 reductase n=1 Tax=Streptomyces sp. NPDC050560 TaxID=3365630 RepID=UPI00378F5D25